MKGVVSLVSTNGDQSLVSFALSKLAPSDPVPVSLSLGNAVITLLSNVQTRGCLVIDGVRRKAGFWVAQAADLSMTAGTLATAISGAVAASESLFIKIVPDALSGRSQTWDMRDGNNASILRALAGSPPADVLFQVLDAIYSPRRDSFTFAEIVDRFDAIASVTALGVGFVMLVDQLANVVSAWFVESAAWASLPELADNAAYSGALAGAHRFSIQVEGATL